MRKLGPTILAPVSFSGTPFALKGALISLMFLVTNSAFVFFLRNTGLFVLLFFKSPIHPPNFILGVSASQIIGLLR